MSRDILNVEPIQKGQIRQVIVNSLANIPMFQDLNEDELELLASHMNIFRLEEGDQIFKEGDSGEFVCFVIEGTLNVVKQNADGQEVKIAILSGGDSIGEMAIIDECPRSATVTVQTEATLLTLTRKRFNFILAEHPEIGVKMLKSFARLLSFKLRTVSSQLSDLVLH